MKPKIHGYDLTAGHGPDDGTRQYWFHCPGCGNAHAFTVGGPPGAQPRWTWNGSYTAPTFQPSLMCNRDHLFSRCHCFVTDGKIQFQSDCWHPLAGKTVEMVDWEY